MLVLFAQQALSNQDDEDLQQHAALIVVQLPPLSVEYSTKKY
jgi:hypothetical protein